MKTIGIIALSGVCNKEKVLKAKSYLENKGYNVKLSSNIYDEKMYLAGDDNKKLAELNSFFKDSEIDIIMCARGGYGAIRLVNNIDYDIIRNNPKVFCGFSDVTALLLMIYKKTGLVTYHGPMLTSDFVDDETRETEITFNYFKNAISNNPLTFEGSKIYKKGKAEGVIWGGNLSTLVSLCGIDFLPQTEFVFFTEDLNEPVYKIDKMFQQLINIPQFRTLCRGIVLGDFLDCGNDEWLEEYFSELAKKLNIPVAKGFKITHNKVKVTIPIGKKCILENCKLVIN